MEIKKRTKEDLRNDVEDFKVVTNDLLKLFESKNEGYGGLWSVNDLKLRFADIERKFVRLAAQVWYETYSASASDILESAKDLTAYGVLMIIEIKRILRKELNNEK